MANNRLTTAEEQAVGKFVSLIARPGQSVTITLTHDYQTHITVRDSKSGRRDGSISSGPSVPIAARNAVYDRNGG